jgi:hypothetical protein
MRKKHITAVVACMVEMTSDTPLLHKMHCMGHNYAVLSI